MTASRPGVLAGPVPRIRHPAAAFFYCDNPDSPQLKSGFNMFQTTLICYVSHESHSIPKTEIRILGV